MQRVLITDADYRPSPTSRAILPVKNVVPERL